MRQNSTARTRRVALAAFIALVSSGLLFYLVIFCSLMIMVAVKGTNPAATPELDAGLRYIAAPIVVTIGFLVFVFANRRLAIREQDTNAPPSEHGDGERSKDDVAQASTCLTTDCCQGPKTTESRSNR